jgi:hypothetical protein
VGNRVHSLRPCGLRLASMLPLEGEPFGRRALIAMGFYGQ